MKIAICGATGATGKHVLNLALEAGHDVRVSARTPSKIEREHARLAVIKGDATDAKHLGEVFEGCEAVVSCLGNGTFFDQRKPTTFYTDTARAILEAMDTAGATARRLLAITSSGVEDDPTAPWFYRKVVKPQLKTYENMTAMEKLVEGSDKGWTIVRPSWLRPGDATKKYRVEDRKNPAKGYKISVGDVAHFIVKELTDPQWDRKHPALAY